MIITLTDNTEIELLAINFKTNQVDYRRISGEYTGDCVMSYEITDIDGDTKAGIKTALESELNI